MLLPLSLFSLLNRYRLKTDWDSFFVFNQKDSGSDIPKLISKFEKHRLLYRFKLSFNSGCRQHCFPSLILSCFLLKNQWMSGLIEYWILMYILSIALFVLLGQGRSWIHCESLLDLFFRWWLLTQCWGLMLGHLQPIPNEENLPYKLK